MKPIKLFFASILGLVLLLTNSCSKDSCTTMVTYDKYTPIYKTLEEMKVDPVFSGPQEMKKTGKIFVTGDYLLINELEKGVHIINNTNPANPENIAFIEVEGNIDMAMKGNTLFLDTYFDIVTIDISDPANPVLKGRSTNAFPINKYYFSKKNSSFLVGYDKKEVTEELPCEEASYYKNDYLYDAFTSSGGSNQPASSYPQNIAGSMASMLVINEHLYLINSKNLLIFSTASEPALLNTVEVDFGIETLYPYQDKLFIGSTSGMFIYDNSDPVYPVELSEFAHVRSCDPVFVKDDIAFVTLRNGSDCGGIVNQLEVIDISDLSNPSLLKTYPMFNPHGLSVDDENLFLCDGTAGLKIFGISDLYAIADNKKYQHGGIEAYDVIRLAEKELVIVIAKEGLFQFDTSTGLNLLSQLNITK